MTDEKYTFISDVREKKRTATGAHHKRTHCGKGGAVKFPSDYMSKKEREAMNGEVKTYRLNSPITLDEFRAMPDDIKISYIKILRDKFGVPDTRIGEMFGCSQRTISRETIRLGISKGKNCKRLEFDEKAWNAWVGREPDESSDSAPQEVPECVAQETTEPTERKIIPGTGFMTFDCAACDALEMVKKILGDSVVKLTVMWS